HELNAYHDHVQTDGTLGLVGARELALTAAAFALIPGRQSFAGSMSGGSRETQEMLEFCGEHQITSDVEIINIQEINQAYERMLKGDVKYRFVIDMKSHKEA